MKAVIQRALRMVSLPRVDPGQPLITAEELLAFHHCRRLPYLDRYGPQTAKAETDDFLRQLQQDRQTLRRQIAQTFPGIRLADSPTRPTPPQSTPIYPETLQFNTAIENPPRIYASKLKASLPSLPDIEILSSPDLLLHSSDLNQIWSEFHPTASRPIPDPGTQPGFYVPVEIRTGKRVKPEYELMLALHTLLLGQIQGITPLIGCVILRDGSWQVVILRKRQQQIEQLTAEFLAVMANPIRPQVYMARSRCNLCSWRSHCRQLAAKEHPLTLLPGVTGGRYPLLESIGITTLTDLATIPTEILGSVPGIGTKAAVQLIRQAQSTLEQRPLWTAPIHLPINPIELYFDVEADPQNNVAYLLGVLVVDRHTQASVYHSCLAPNPRDEIQGWAMFLDLISAYPNAPIYHFHAFEVQTCQKLGQRYDTDPDYLECLLQQFVDLHELVVQKLVLPVESYSLKHIARWLGFEWRQADARGSQSIYWYARWLETGDRSFLESSVIYNEDDCRATYHLKQWLERSAPDQPSIF